MTSSVCRMTSKERTLTNDSIDKDGYQAYWDGVAADGNPYPPGTEQWRSWKDGWAQAQLEDFITGG